MIELIELKTGVATQSCEINLEETMKTGRKDKNGIDIYGAIDFGFGMTEGGDKLIDEAGDIYKIQYYADWSAFVGINELGDVLMMNDLEDCEIIKKKNKI